ncbi:glycosyltransferase [Spirulina sp. CS-785/01]|uniref:glycosyltransferase n=1 Tax=Spirulina sp. CS-785/01 TaxID=3021716 RepID=UPI00232E9914|nr:glycosyltransferase [Spirulina sp. CS-785/01]MDB9315904.1 glycosyltransferase [Spirulina sp. CS-785/01]
MTIQKVAIFTHGLDGGAFTNLGTTLARGFTELGYHCDLVLLKVTEAEKARYPELNLVSLNVPRAISAIGPLVRYINTQQPDVIFPMPWYFNVVAIWSKLLARTSTKVIIGEHNIISLEAGIELRHQLRMRFLPFLMRYTYPYGDGLIAVCQDSITDLAENLNIKPNIPMEVIPN